MSRPVGLAAGVVAALGLVCAVPAPPSAAARSAAVRSAAVTATAATDAAAVGGDTVGDGTVGGDTVDDHTAGYDTVSDDAVGGNTESGAQAAIEAAAQAYVRDSAASASAAGRLASAYALVAAAQEEVGAAAADSDRARGELAERALELYEFGPGSDAALTLLTADSPADGLWTLAVGAPLADRLLREAADDGRAAQRRAARAAALDARALAAADRIDGLLTGLRTSEAAASWDLQSARAQLARLRATDALRARLAAARMAQAEQQADATGLPTSVAVGALPIPTAFDRAYHDAATTCPGMSWTLLAAVGQVESGDGRDDGPSSAGAVGPMQFMPETFAEYAVDAEHDGRPDPWDTRDAVFTAARYLCANGAGSGPSGVQAAVFAYNHAQWYVDLVLAVQRAVVATYGTS